VDLQTAREMVARVPTWYHSFEVFPGVITPGVVPVSSASLDYYGIVSDLSGKEALEIATFDGPMAFELEKRGARVTALDIQDPSRTGFNTAKAILGSHVQYVQGSVYDLAQLLPGQVFDIVLFFGVFYHLKNPVLAFEQVARSLRDDRSELFIEGECLLNYIEDASGTGRQDVPLDFLTSEDFPVALFYSGTYKGDDSNWYVPNVACIRNWLQAAGLELIRHHLGTNPQLTPPLQRIGGMARRTKQPLIEHRTR
jgi:SAM-dependent methyltransferase